MLPLNLRRAIFTAILAASPVTSAVTDTGTTPSTTALTLPSWATGFRVVPGETPVGEGTFFLYVQIGGGAVAKVQSTRWRDQFFAAPPGSTVKLSTSDGRTVGVCPVVVPATLTPPTPVTGTANCDDGVPGLWAPSAPHVTLAGYHQQITVTNDATPRWLFVSEHDGRGWTAPRWYRLEAGYSYTLLCTYKRVALATHDGGALTVAAPAGATIGGTKTRMSLPFPAITGTTFNVTTVAELKAAFAAAVSGDLISIADGTYALDIAVTRNTFAANNGVNNRAGMEGITIRGASGNRANVVLTGDGSGTHGDWGLIHDFGGNTGYGCVRDVTFDFTGIAAGFEVQSGKWLFQNVRATGVSSNADDAFSIAGNSNRAVVADCLYCDADNAGSDCWNSDGNAATNAAGRIRLFSCGGTLAGVGDSSQVVTTHNGMPLEIYGGLFTDAQANVVANDAGTSVCHLFFVTTSPGARKGGCLNSNLYACDITVGATNGTGPPAYAVFNRIHTPSGGATIFRSSGGTPITATTIRHNWLTSASTVGRAYHASVGGGDFCFNVMVGFTTVEAIRIADYTTGSTASIDLYGNTGVSNTTFANLGTTNIPVVFTHNAARISGTSITTNSTQDGLLTKGRNVLDPTVNVNYTADATDTTGVDAALDTTAGPGLYRPTAAGNCDGTGDPAATDWAGGFDPLGFDFRLDPTTMPRGARTRPVLTGGLIPSVF